MGGRRASLTTERVVWLGVSSPLFVRSYNPNVSIGFRNRTAVFPQPSLVGASFGPSHFTLRKRECRGQCQSTLISLSQRSLGDSATSSRGLGLAFFETRYC